MLSHLECGDNVPGIPNILQGAGLIVDSEDPHRPVIFTNTDILRQLHKPLTVILTLRGEACSTEVCLALSSRSAQSCKCGVTSLVVQASRFISTWSAAD